VILVESFERSTEDRYVIAFRKVGRSGVGEPGLFALGLRLGRLVGERALHVVLL
jgi:hypothetical protein